MYHENRLRKPEFVYFRGLSSHLGEDCFGDHWSGASEKARVSGALVHLGGPWRGGDSGCWKRAPPKDTQGPFKGQLHQLEETEIWRVGSCVEISTEGVSAKQSPEAGPFSPQETDGPPTGLPSTLGPEAAGPLDELRVCRSEFRPVPRSCGGTEGSGSCSR